MKKILLCLVVFTAAAAAAPLRHGSPAVPKRIDADGHLYEMTCTTDYKLDGMVAAGARSVEEMLGYARDSIIPGAAERLTMEIGAGCSSFTAYTPEGEVIFGRNYDYRHSPVGVVLHTAPEGGYRSVGIADAAWLGYTPGSLDDGRTDISALAALPYATLDGVNEKGLCISVMQLNDHHTAQDDPDKRDISTTTAIRLALDRCATVDEVISLWSKYNMHSAQAKDDFHFLVADASGKTLVIEYCNGKMTLVNTRFVTNDHLNPVMDAHPEKCPRYGMLYSALTHARDTLSGTDAMNLLSLVRQSGAGKGGSRSGAPTQWSAVYNLTRKEMKVCVNSDYANSYSFGLE